MNLTDLNNDKELVTLHHILEASGCTVSLPDEPSQKGYIFRFSHDKSKLGRDFEQAAEDLVPKQGGEVSQLRSMSGGGFSAFFPTEETRLGFMHAFNRAASALVPEPTMIVRTNKGFMLGCRA